MNIWHDIEKNRITATDFIAVIEISKGAKQKYELDKATGLLILDRILYTATHYPANYGFIPRTYADDGDPLDVLVLCSESLEPVSLVRCKPIGVIIMTDGGNQDEKIIAVPYGDPVYHHYDDIFQLPEHVTAEMEHFFRVYKQLENNTTATLHQDQQKLEYKSSTYIHQTYGKKDAERIIAACIDNYEANRDKLMNK